MSLNQDDLSLLAEAMKSLERGFSSLPACPQELDSPAIRRVLLDAAARLKDLGVANAELVLGDGLAAGLAPGTFDAIAVTGSVPSYPEALEALLECCRIAETMDSPAVKVWLGDGTNYPSQEDLR